MILTKYGTRRVYGLQEETPPTLADQMQYGQDWSGPGEWGSSSEYFIWAALTRSLKQRSKKMAIVLWIRIGKMSTGKMSRNSGWAYHMTQLSQTGSAQWRTTYSTNTNFGAILERSLYTIQNVIPHSITFKRQGCWHLEKRRQESSSRAIDPMPIKQEKMK